MIIKTFQGGFDKNLSYLVWCEHTRRAVVIDPSVATTPIVEAVAIENLILEKVIVTHSHADHFSYLEDYLHLFPNLGIYCYKNPTNSITKNHHGLSHQEIVAVGRHLFTVIHTPGHFPDSICLWSRDNSCIFTGDTIFVGRTGRVIGAGSNIQDLYNSVYNKILLLPPDTMIYPGHHYGHTKSISIKENIKISELLLCSSLKEFIKTMERYEKSRSHDKR